MEKIAAVLSFIVFSMLVVSACAPPPTEPPEPTASIPTGSIVTAVSGGIIGKITPAPATATALESAAGEPVTITLQDQGRTINMKVAESFMLKLGEQYTWDISISDQNVLHRVKDVTYEALQPGAATLTASGDPLCRQSKPACGMPSTLFTLTVVVK